MWLFEPIPMLKEKKKEKGQKMAETVSQSILWKLIWKYLEGSIEKYPAMSID